MRRAVLVGLFAVCLAAIGGCRKAAQVSLPGEPVQGEPVVTASGLQYYVLAEGTGEPPVPGSSVSVHYTGYLMDGTKFDSSIDRQSPITFVLGQGQVIQGWDEGIALMKPGAKYKLVIPPELAYGAAGLRPSIPPNATLVFDVELLAQP